MRIGLWYFGKFLQFGALCLAPYALITGFDTHDSRRELSLLGIAVLQFILGLGFLKLGSSRP